MDKLAKQKDYKSCGVYYWMISRCENTKTERYPNYGGRGIEVCKRWRESFWNFLEDMGDVPAGYSIERIDVNGNYEKTNCKWIPISDQAKNKVNTDYVVYKGIKYRLQDLAIKLNVKYGTLYYRVHKFNLPEEKWHLQCSAKKGASYKLSPQQLVEIKSLKNGGKTNKEIAVLYGVNPKTISLQLKQNTN